VGDAIEASAREAGLLIARPRAAGVIVVDTSALLAILNKEPERDRPLDVLANDDRVMVSAVTPNESMLVAAARRVPIT
jgi:hypothetical protein